MSRPTDYLAAAVRWRRDLESLPQEATPESTDHLAGLAAECACKVLLQAFGARGTPDGGLADKRHLVHLPQVLDELLCHAAGRSAAAVFAHLPPSNPFRTWAIDDRYVADGQLTKDECEAHLAGLAHIFCALQAAALDGGLS